LAVELLARDTTLAPRRRVRASITLLASAVTFLSACDLGAAPGALEEAAAGGTGLIRLGGVDRIEQLTGDTDRERGVPTRNQTGPRARAPACGTPTSAPPSVTAASAMRTEIARI
jgi:hypothetical protein